MGSLCALGLALGVMLLLAPASAPAALIHPLLGDFGSVSYNDGGFTPGCTWAYDRRGRQSTVSCNGITTTGYSLPWLLCTVTAHARAISARSA